MLEQSQLDLRGIHVLAPRDDEVAAPVQDAQPARGVEGADVTRVQPAAPERPGGLPGPVRVALHHARPPHEDLARRAGRHVPTPLVDDAHARPGQGRQGQEVGIVRFGIAGRHLGCGLGQAVGRQHPEAACRSARQQRRRAGAATQQHEAQRPGRVTRAARVQQVLQHRRGQRDLGDPVPIEGFAQRIRIEAFVDHAGGAVQGAAQQDRQAAHVEQRHADQPAVAGIDPEVKGRSHGAP
jgi:hypothetical protein